MGRTVLVVATFSAVHLLTLAGDLRIAVAVILSFMVLGLGAQVLPRLLPYQGRVPAIAAILLACAGALAIVSDTGVHLALIVPPLIGYVAVSLFFAFSLLPGEVPVIERLCRLGRETPLPDGLEAYARALTWGWAILPAALAASALLILATAGVESWSWMTNIANPLILIAFFVGEHVFRGIFFPQFGRPSLMHTVDLMFTSQSRRH